MKRILFAFISLTQLVAMDQTAQLEKYFDAIKADKVAEMEQLLKNGIDINAANWHGETGLWVACCHRSYGCIERLLQSSDIKVETNSPSTPANRTPLHFLARETDQEKIKSLIVQLLQKGADPNYKNGYNRTVLEEVIHASDSIILLEPLIKAGASLEPGYEQRTPVELGILCKHTAQVQELLRIVPSARAEALRFIEKMINDPDWQSNKIVFEEIKKKLIEK